MKMAKTKIIIESTLYSLMIYWLKEEIDNTIYVLDSSIHINIINKLKKNHKVFIFNSLFDKSILHRAVYVYFTQKIKLYFFIKNYLTKNTLIFSDDKLIAFDMFRNYNYTLIEDGIDSYIPHHHNNKGVLYNFLRDKLRNFGKGKPFGESDKCKRIYLTGLAPIPKQIKEKVEHIDIKELWDKKSEAEKIEILEIFDFSEDDIYNIKSRDIILLTQPIFEDGFVSEEEKISIYKNALKQYNHNSIIIKTHPREQTNYRNFFPETIVIDKPFPFELFLLLGVKIKKIITLFSSTALHLGKDVEIEWLGVHVHPKLSKVQSKNIFSK